ncbi:PaaX family transcriptional regulator C-terminal domain-containing protein [Arthrobacter sp. JSM 101049]|uniref:PaaX family transcriptional regulator n=1 Tax=Arthrobacter sp. JSM 101049 TaxID=929097 RepID=UPI003569751B
MSAVLDDMDSRPGSTASLLRTIIGLYLREAGGWMSSARLVDLMEAVGTPAALTRTSLTRLRKKGVLDAETRDGVAGYAVGARARHMLERGDRRIHQPRAMGPEDPWCLVSFTVPESERGLRHQLRRRLHWIGCGTVGPGLWICPDYLRAEAGEILEDLGLRGAAVLFTTGTPQVQGPLREAVAGWWDLDDLATLHRGFLESQRGVPDQPPADAAAAFASYVRCIDSWRIIPYVDPGLPAGCLPEGWPGAASSVRFLELRDAYRPAALAFVHAVTGEQANPALAGNHD